MGAPKGNKNNLQHGLRSSAPPPAHGYVARELRILRRNIEAEAVAVLGEITLTTASAISACCEWHKHRLLAARWLRDQHDSLTPDQRLAFSRDVARAAENADRILRGMGLSGSDGKGTGKLSSLPALADLQPAPTPTPSPTPQDPERSEVVDG